MRNSFIHSLYGGGNSDAGLTYLKENAYAYYDFTQESVGTVASVSSLGASTRNADVVSSDVNIEQTSLGLKQYNAAKLVSDGINEEIFKIPFSNIIENDHELWFCINNPALPVDTDSLIGVIDTGVAAAPNYQILMKDNIPYDFNININGTASRYTIGTSVFDPSIPQGQTIFRWRVDWGNELKCYLNGVEKTISKFSGSDFNTVSVTNASAMNQELFIGDLNVDGSAFRQDKDYDFFMYRLAFTPLLTDEQAAQVFSYFQLAEE